MFFFIFIRYQSRDHNHSFANKICFIFPPFIDHVVPFSPDAIILIMPFAQSSALQFIVYNQLNYDRFNYSISMRYTFELVVRHQLIHLLILFVHFPEVFYTVDRSLEFLFYLDRYWWTLLHTFQSKSYPTNKKKKYLKLLFFVVVQEFNHLRPSFLWMQ